MDRDKHVLPWLDRMAIEQVINLEFPSAKWLHLTKMSLHLYTTPLGLNTALIVPKC